jgi:hypothetical protein
MPLITNRLHGLKVQRTTDESSTPEPFFVALLTLLCYDNRREQEYCLLRVRPLFLFFRETLDFHHLKLDAHFFYRPLQIIGSFFNFDPIF